jgi:hypothetical protein
MMARPTIKEIGRSIAELDVLLAEEGINLPLLDVTVEKGLQLAEVLNEKLRLFLVRYTALVNRNRAYVAVDTSKLEVFLPLAEELSRCVEPFLFSNGVAYSHALKLIINGFKDAEEAVIELFWALQLTDDFRGVKNLLTYYKGDSGAIGFAVEKNEQAEG